MGLLIGLIIFGVIGFLVLWGVIGIAAVGAVAAEGKGRAEAVSASADTLDRLFTTGSPTATYDARPFNSIPQTRVIEGAIQRGWELANNDGGLLLFRRATA